MTKSNVAPIEVAETPVNAMNGITAEHLNIEDLDAIMKDLRNTRRAVLAIDTGRVETEEKVAQAKLDLQAALDKADLEEITTHTDALKRGLRKLAEKPAEKITAFNAAVDKLVAFTFLTAEPAEDKADDEVAA